ncbi:MAG: sugar transferase [Pseudorhodobacter sp.]|nr:MAG: sugar transferase [Pseudorhodobacter sp.]
MTFPDLNAGFGMASDANVLAARAMPPKKGLYRNALKRVLDLTAILMAAPVVVPVVAGLAIWVARDGGKPFYSQMRVGKDGKRFRMWKLRSMVCDADERMEDYLAAHPEARLEWDTTQKLKDDPRITPVGKIIRQTSLDELPQLWNVFVGEMSLVGPRPIMLSQQVIYPGVAYYHLRPGCTGYWQIAGRNRTTFEARAEYDTAYDENLSFMTDLKILFSTIGVMLRGTGY